MFVCPNSRKCRGSSLHDETFLKENLEALFVYRQTVGFRPGSDDLIMNGEECILAVSRSRSSVSGKGVVEGTTKNGQARTIYISEEMTTVLRCYCYYKMYEAREGGGFYKG